jgi:hypothetical protein
MKYLPDRKVLATGVTGLLIWIISLIAEFYGIAVSSDVLGAAIAVIAPAVGWMIPPAVKDVAARLDADLRRVFEERQSTSPGLTPPVD